MFKKALLLLLALLFTVGAHLRPCCEFRIDGKAIAPVCGLRAAARAERAASAAAEEILRAAAEMPAAEKHTRLRLRRPEGNAAMLTDALLRATEGVALRGEVSVDGTRLGWVADGDALRDTLRDYIGNTLPTWASGGVLSRELTIRRLYTRAERLTPTRDMLLLVTGAAPVFYYDNTGRFARA